MTVRYLSFVFLLSVLLAGCSSQEGGTTGAPTPTPEPVNLLENSDFSGGSDPWILFVQDPAKASMGVENGMLVFDISSIGQDVWHVQPGYPAIPLTAGHTYRLAFDMKASEPRTVQVRIQKDGPPWTGYLEENFQLGTEMQHYTFEFTMQETDEAARLVFNCGTAAEGTAPSAPHKIYLDNIVLLDLSGETTAEESEKETAPPISLNQIGYLPSAPKIFFTTVDAGTFSVVDQNTGEEVFSGTLSEPVDDPDSGDNTVRKGDFTALTSPGTYVVKVGEITSVPFEIGEEVYKDLHTALFRFFYLQRCGVDLDPSLAGIWAHPACHTTPALIYGSSETKDVRGGWHDAGDYGRYVVPAAKAVADLILTYLFYPETASSDAMGIPESGNGIPDILDEAKDELLWILKMQDPASGGVYHKVTTRNFAGFDWPQNTGGEPVLSPISPTATADFAAVMAMAARVYAPLDAEFAATCRAAAEKAWAWLTANPDAPGFKNPSGISTGEYGDEEDGDERYWAAAELFALIGDETYHTYLKESYANSRWKGLGWIEVGDYGTITYLFFTPRKDETFAATLTSDILSRADEILSLMADSGYRISLDSYYWGSNMGVANNGMLFLVAYTLTGKEKYRSAAYEQLDYLLGRNPLSTSYITGFGEKAPEHPHHRISVAAGKAIPGMVVGGPNSGLQDPVAQGALRGEPPAKCYIDDVGSYSTNEVTIYWNSPAVFLVSGLIR